MRLCFNTDGLGYMPFEEMLDTLAALGYESVEIACGNWSKAPISIWTRCWKAPMSGNISWMPSMPAAWNWRP